MSHKPVIVFHCLHVCVLAYRDHCIQCCHRDESGYTVKRYAQARLEVCTCKFGAYPQIQGRYWYLTICNVKRWIDGDRFLIVLHELQWLFIVACHEMMLCCTVITLLSKFCNSVKTAVEGILAALLNLM
jgi:hypothetical protein